MIKFDAWYLPDGEKHLQEWMLKVNRLEGGRLNYQKHKYDAAIALCPNRRTAVDVGAHVGLLSYWMAKDFAHVESFEPVAAHRECFEANIDSVNVFLHACALGEERGNIGMVTAPTSSGDSRVSGPGDIPMLKLDDFNLEDVDFLKLDLEGSELFALRGGEETIKRCRPVLMVEQKKGHAQRFGVGETAGVDYLHELGMTTRQVISGDYILTF